MKPLLSLLVSLCAAGSAVAQGYPNKPITLVIPFAAGGDSDLSGRLLAQHAAKYLGNATFVPLNKVGASGSIGTMQVRTAPADGYTMLVARIATHAVYPALDSKSPYKWNEFTMLSLLELNPYICAVRADSPIKTVQDLYAQIRKEPGKLNFSTAGPGTSQNMAAQYMMSLAGFKSDAAVGIHYKGGGEVTTAVLGGQVQFACNNATTMVSQIRAGALRGLFVTTPVRLAELPNLQTAREAGVPDMEKIVGWTAIMGPPGLPKEVVDRWTSVLASIAKDPEWLAGIAKIGGIPAIRSPVETEKYVKEQLDLYDKLITTLGIRL
ncbi:MAG: Bug family tripartite tricarboxylate transporter substrate binding protein [Burkholderiales bacterium]